MKTRTRPQSAPGARPASAAGELRREFKPTHNHRPQTAKSRQEDMKVIEWRQNTLNRIRRPASCVGGPVLPRPYYAGESHKGEMPTLAPSLRKLQMNRMNVHKSLGFISRPVPVIPPRGKDLLQGMKNLKDALARLDAMKETVDTFMKLPSFGDQEKYLKDSICVYHECAEFLRKFSNMSQPPRKPPKKAVEIMSRASVYAVSALHHITVNLKNTQLGGPLKKPLLHALRSPTGLPTALLPKLSKGTEADYTYALAKSIAVRLLPKSHLPGRLLIEDIGVDKWCDSFFERDLEPYFMDIEMRKKAGFLC